MSTPRITALVEQLGRDGVDVEVERCDPAALTATATDMLELARLLRDESSGSPQTREEVPMDMIYAFIGRTIFVRDAGIKLVVDLNDDGQPVVMIDTEGMPASYVYDEATGLPGTAAPYTYEQDGACAVVKGPTGEVVARHFPHPDSVSARLAALQHCAVLNDRWPEECGMPDICVLLGDATLYDSDDHNPALRERRQQDITRVAADDDPRGEADR